MREAVPAEATEQIIQMAKANNGIVTAAMITAAEISRGNLKYLADRGVLSREARGLYVLAEGWGDEMLALQNRFKRGIFSLETALYLWDLTDRTPQTYTMTFPATYNLQKPKAAGIRCRQCSAQLYALGIAQAKTPGGNAVNVYDRERTLCDLLRARNGVDIQLVSKAFKRYAACAGKNIPQLSEYAKVLHVEKKLRSYLEVLL